ncbi:acetyl/propionyl/methylcrotonyl-CoA carboxylase subunit alpha [Rhodoligotrophos ferricapiens]|uniref:acetyl/propionyl/methylcrotonyl-CoA carboxylase subunit alpha n=1 Tax=Rhodoligotrophos ferricapiens TaxID=3069264 RepID=UPI00315D8C2F
MISSLLIANRGEIAVRIIRTCRRLGIRTIAVFSDADRNAPHVAAADQAVRIGPAAARDSYLRLDAIMDAAARTGAEAIHPGYGFLSERPELALSCAEAGIVFVGPSAACIEAMGQKIGSKLIAEKAGVASVPGYIGDDQSADRLVKEALRIGLPVMVKASAGGGGKGMRRVLTEAELRPAIEIARREAEASFGDPSLLIEKLVMRPRHLEVQVAGDKHGHVIHLFERDCSVQRNNQKLIEEAPAPNLDPAIREKLLERAVRLARAIDYDNLGTVEFILEDGEAEPWFLEMNTRLQVEHPVTEAITGFDLVEWQLRIASGEPLPVDQDRVRARGHAIEARITAEQADHDFRPDAGAILAYHEPPSIRVDSGIEAGSEVTLFYDSMLAKAIASGEDRNEARTKLASALRDFTLLGPATTIPFLADSLEHAIFAEGRATTRFIAEAFPDGWQRPKPKLRLARAAATLIAGERASEQTSASAWTQLQGFRVLAPAGGRAETHLVISTAGAPPAKVTVFAETGGARGIRDDEGELILNLRHTGNRLELETADQVLRGFFDRQGGMIRLGFGDETYAFEIASAAAAALGAAAKGAGSGAITAALPGLISEVNVAEGDHVEAGQQVIVLESMKLFIPLTADVSGTVSEIACRPGQTVQSGQRLLVIDPDPA